MIHADKRFSEAVATKVRELEQATDAEVVVVASEASGSYLDVAHLVGGAAAVLTLGVLVSLPWRVHSAMVVLDLVLVWALVAWLASGSRVVARLAGAQRRQDQVRTAAAAEFHLEAVHATPHRTGLLVYVSAWEGLVELVPDVGLEAVIPRGTWSEAAQRLTTTDIESFVAGLDEVGQVLAEHVPHTGGSRAELPDAPRIR